MERVITSVKLTGKGERTGSNVLKTSYCTGTVRNKSKSGIFIAAGAKIRQEFYTLKSIVRRIITNTACRKSYFKSQVIKIVFYGKTEERRSCRCVNIIQHLIHFFYLRIVIVVRILDISFKFKQLTVTYTGVKDINGILFSYRPFSFHSVDCRCRLSGLVYILKGIICKKYIILS